MLRKLIAATTIGVVALAAGCGDSHSDVADNETAPFHAVPEDADIVVGTVSCELTEDGVDLDDPEEGSGGWLVVCELDLSDPRVSGTERHDRFRWLAEGNGGLVWIAEDAVITNDDGSWRGSAQAADSGGPVNGEAHYVGEGAYEGLEFHYYFNAVDEGELRGWIYDSD